MANGSPARVSKDIMKRQYLNSILGQGQGSKRNQSYANTDIKQIRDSETKNN